MLVARRCGTEINSIHASYYSTDLGLVDAIIIYLGMMQSFFFLFMQLHGKVMKPIKLAPYPTLPHRCFSLRLLLSCTLSTAAQLHSICHWLCVNWSPQILCGDYFMVCSLCCKSLPPGGVWFTISSMWDHSQPLCLLFMLISHHRG